jgi:hypothetical protein
MTVNDNKACHFQHIADYYLKHWWLWHNTYCKRRAAKYLLLSDGD